MKIIVAITGASGVIYGLELAKKLNNHELFIIVTENAKKVMEHETNNYKEELEKLKELGKFFESDDIEAPIASGSFGVDAMVVCPCSMKTLAAIANGFSDNLVARCSDVMIKEKRRLILVPRETPLSPIHLENMLKLSKIGISIIPACPAFYNKPKTVNDMVNFVVGKILDILKIDNNLYNRWN